MLLYSLQVGLIQLFTEPNQTNQTFNKLRTDQLQDVIRI
ncbi:hypothetical protein PSHT_15205 [Puccinia striiformis]|uniref:Uncharacterized protein n=1 Tax=Puccinia striiformis TaxID=27350 RepID=A0A2S4UGN7_9BASI|nr:hypothetical protein PSHT_15205 [Puccinia striiformis]